MHHVYGFQAVEKYLKAFLQEAGVPVPRTHDLDELLLLILPHDPTLKRLQRGLNSLSHYAVKYRYPVLRARARQMHSAPRLAECVRRELRQCLGLVPQCVATKRQRAALVAKAARRKDLGRGLAEAGQ